MSFSPPAAGELQALRPFQGLWRGFVFGEGTDFIVTDNMEGFLAYESRISDQSIPMADGDIVYGRWAAGRFVSIPISISGVALTSVYEDKVAAFFRAFETDDPYREDWLCFKTVSRLFMIRCRVARRQVELSPFSTKTGVTPAVVEFKVADPKIYQPDAVTWGVKSIFVPTTVASGGGFDLTTELPIDMTAATGGTGIASNTGNADVYPFLRVSNALGAGSNITEFVVTNATHDQSVHVITDITPGQTLVMDFDALVRAEKGPHVYIDTSSRYGDWQQPRTPLAIRPGDNTFFAEVEGGTPTVRLDWMDALL